MVRKQAWKVVTYLINFEKILKKRKKEIIQLPKYDLANFALVQYIEQMVDIIEVTLGNFRKLGLVYELRFFSKYSKEARKRINKRKEEKE